MLLRLAHGNGALTGADVVDLETGEERHSPEIGTDLGIPAWAPDSRYVIYPFHGDLMIWDTDSLSGQLRSSRASLRLDLSDIHLQGCSDAPPSGGVALDTASVHRRRSRRPGWCRAPAEWPGFSAPSD